MGGAVTLLKNSVRIFEKFDDKKYEQTEKESQEQKFIEEFFSDKHDPMDILPKEFTAYDIKANNSNQEFLKTLFSTSNSILPVQNLGEIAYILNKQKEAFAFFDISMKLYQTKDPNNFSKLKVLSMLSALIDMQGQRSASLKLSETILDQAKKIEYPMYERVFITKNHGHMLTKHADTRMEGEEFIKKSEAEA